MTVRKMEPDIAEVDLQAEGGQNFGKKEKQEGCQKPLQPRSLKS